MVLFCINLHFLSPFVVTGGCLLGHPLSLADTENSSVSVRKLKCLLSLEDYNNFLSLSLSHRFPMSDSFFPPFFLICQMFGVSFRLSTSHSVVDTDHLCRRTTFRDVGSRLLVPVIYVGTPRGGHGTPSPNPGERDLRSPPRLLGHTYRTWETFRRPHRSSTQDLPSETGLRVTPSPW